MKKLFFSAMACIAFAGSTFASNEVVKEVKLLEVETKNSPDKVEFEPFNCKVTISYYEDGILKSQTYYSTVGSQRGCNSFGNDKYAQLVKDGKDPQSSTSTYAKNGFSDKEIIKL